MESFLLPPSEFGEGPIKSPVGYLELQGNLAIPQIPFKFGVLLVVVESLLRHSRLAALKSRLHRQLRHVRRCGDFHLQLAR